MNLQELTELLVTSSEHFNQTKFIPWWEGNHEDFTYKYSILPAKTVEEAESLIAECGTEELLAPVGSIGLTLFHLLVWHNFYDAVKKMLCDGRVEGGNVDLPDHNGHGLTPFLLACSRGNLAMVRLLLEHGAKDSVSDERDMNAYHFLVYPRFREPAIDCLRQSVEPGIVVNSLEQNAELAVNFSCLEQSVEQRGEIARLLTCDINQKNKAGLTPLEHLLSLSHCCGYTWPLAEVFLEKGAKTDYEDGNGNTLLMMARRNGHETASLKLMKQCPELLDVSDNNGVTPIRLAINFQNQAMYLALIDHGATPVTDKPITMFPLRQITSNIWANVSRDNRDSLALSLFMTKKLISQLDPDDDDELGEVTAIFHNALLADKEAHVLEICKDAGLDFTMPIHYHGDILCLRDKCLNACYGIGVIRKLIELGVDMDKAVIRGRTPANIIASGEKRRDAKDEAYFEETAKLFSKESMEQLDNSGVAAIHLAAEYGHTGMLQVMLEKGVDINLTEDAPAEAGATALHCACANGHTDVVRLLIAAGADDTLKTLRGETPAHFAVMKKKFGQELRPEERAGLLKELKNLDLPREDGRTPLMLLQDIWNAKELLTILLNCGVNVNHVDNNGMTALMLNTDKDMTKELLRAGADINLADNAGNTALHYTLKECAAENARYLIKKGADYNRANNQGITPVQIAVEKGYDTVLELMTDIK